MCKPGRCLAEILASIEEHDTSYETRYQLVMHAVCRALDDGLEAGFRIDPAEPEWPVAYIELPTGQVSWHMPQHKHEFDGHSTAEKYERIHAYQRQVAGDTAAS